MLLILGPIAVAIVGWIFLAIIYQFRSPGYDEMKRRHPNRWF
jgi:hypothetical protein